MIRENLWINDYYNLILYDVITSYMLKKVANWNPGLYIIIYYYCIGLVTQIIKKLVGTTLFFLSTIATQNSV